MLFDIKWKCYVECCGVHLFTSCPPRASGINVKYTTKKTAESGIFDRRGPLLELDTSEFRGPVMAT